MSTSKVLGAVLAVLLTLAGIDYGLGVYGDWMAKDNTTVLKNFDPDAITALDYRSAETQPATEFSAKLTADEAFIITSPIGTPADTLAIKNLAVAVSNAHYIRKVAEDTPTKERLEEFGLADPEVAIAFTTPKGKHHLMIGSQAPTRKGRYAAVAGKPGVFLVPDELFLELSKPLLAFRDRRIVSIPLSRLEEIRYQASPTGTGRLTAVTLLRDGAEWRLEDGQRGSSTSITDFVTALNTIEAGRIIDNPSESLLAAYNPRGRNASPLMTATFAVESAADITITVLQLADSLLAYQNPKDRLYFLPLSARSQLLYTAYDFTYRRVLALNWLKITKVQVGKRLYVKQTPRAEGAGQPSADGSGQGEDAKSRPEGQEPGNELGKEQGNDPGNVLGKEQGGSRWRATADASGQSPLTVNIKALLIALEFAKASAIYTSDTLPDGYDEVAKTEVVLTDAVGKATTLAIAKLPRHKGGVAIIHHSQTPERYYEVSLATARHLP